MIVPSMLEGHAVVGRRRAGELNGYVAGNHHVAANWNLHFDEARCRDHCALAIELSDARFPPGQRALLQAMSLSERVHRKARRHLRLDNLAPPPRRWRLFFHGNLLRPRFVTPSGHPEQMPRPTGYS